MNGTPISPDVPSTLLAHAAPTALALAALATARLVRGPERSFRLARAGALTALLLATAHLIDTATGSATGLAQAVVQVLITTLGVVLTRFSSSYLRGEPGQQRFAGWLLATLAASTLIVATDHLLVLLIAWLATSLCLQNLLLFYGERVVAQLAAHKKFLASRTADICMLAAALLLFEGHGTLHLSELGAAIGERGLVGWSDTAAALLVATAAILKSAQLPVHGWLMQVMEAPTPVSALLHAGVINLGGFVLIRLGALIAAVPAAQLLLVIVGGVTAAIAALVATTQTRVKASLAWSTCAQMGFMLLQCGLGLYEMALLHLVAHSIYKAHTFLTAGEGVLHQQHARLAGPSRAARPMLRLLTTGIAVSLAIAATSLLAPNGTPSPAVLVMATIVALAVAPLPARIGVVRGSATAVGVLVLWLTLHQAMTAQELTPTASTPIAAAITAAVLFAALTTFDLLREALPQAAATRWLQQHLYAGLHLDAWFTELTTRVFRWRPRSLASTDGRQPQTHMHEGDTQ